MLVFLFTFYFVSQRATEVQKQNLGLVVENFQNTIIEEVRVAYTVENGYSREFSIPKHINTLPYTIGIDASTVLVINYSGQSYAKVLPGIVRGGFCFKRELDPVFYRLLISKDAGIVSLSTCPDCGYSYYMCDNAQTMGFCDIMEGISPGFRLECCDGHCRCC